MNKQPAHRQALPEGTRLQEFELRRFLGAGGFGIAYLGWNTELKIQVAIKEYLPSDCAVRERSLSVVPKSADDQEVYEWGLGRFLEEAQVLARFKHRSIVQIYRFFRAHGTGYIAMEYVEGQTLSDWLAGRDPLSEMELRRILFPLLDGLKEVHCSGLMHRDIKPGNIIVRAEDDSPVLLDFGAARQTVMAKSRSVTAVLTPGYAPIEQYSEKGGQGPWTDIYALGALCYRALTGKPPEESTNRVLKDSLAPLGEVCREQGSPGFLRAVDWALRVRQEDRPKDLTEWRAALDSGQVQEKSGEPEDRKPALTSDLRPKRRYLDWKIGRGSFTIALLLSFGLVALEDRREAEEMVWKAEAEREAVAEAARRKAEAERRAVEMEEVNAKDENGWTPLHHVAAFNESPAAAQVLLDAGANAFATDDEYGLTPLHSAVAHNENPAVTQVLLDAGTNVDARAARAVGGLTPLHVAAAQNKNPAVAQVLLNAGANAFATNDENGWTPLHSAAAYNENSAMAQVLLDAGTNVDAKSKTSWTPLHSAAAHNENSAVAQVLLNAGANVNAKDKTGWTPLDLHSKYNEGADWSHILIQAGGRCNMHC